MRIKFRSSFSKLWALMGKSSFIKLGMAGMTTQRFGIGVYFHMFRFVWFCGGRGPILFALKPSINRCSEQAWGN